MVNITASTTLFQFVIDICILCVILYEMMYLGIYTNMLEILMVIRFGFAFCLAFSSEKYCDVKCKL